MRGRVGVGRGEVCVVPVSCLHSDLYSVDTFFFPIWKGNLGKKEEKVAFSSFLALMQRELANPSYQSVRK